jgi:hypothetical protein
VVLPAGRQRNAKPYRENEMSRALTLRLFAAALLIGLATQAALVFIIVALRLEYLTSLLAALTAFFVCGIYMSRQEGHEVGLSTLAVSGPTAFVFGMFAWNAGSWLLLSIPLVAAMASVSGMVLGHRWRRTPDREVPPAAPER